MPEFELTWTIIIFCSLAFLIAGFIDSIAGGGGLITVPSLLLTGLPPHFVLGTGKLSSTMGSITALFTFAQGKMLCMKIAPFGFAVSFAGAALGSWIALQVEASLLGKIIVFLLPVGLVFSLMCGGISLSDGELPTKGLWARVALIGFIIGAYDGFFGPGAGSFFLIALHLLCNMGLVKASANAKIFNLASNVGALCTFATGGSVLYALAIPCGLASIVGNRLGARFAMKIGPRFVRGVLYFSLSILFISLVYRFFVS